MIRIQTEKQVIDAFREIDQSEVQIPHNITFPFLVRDYFAWTEPGGHRTFLIFNDEETKNLLGVVFKRTQESPDAPAKMCEFCHSVRGHGNISMLSAKVTPNKTIGLHLCRDLSCREKVESIPGTNDLTGSKDRMYRNIVLVERIRKFLRSKIFFAIEAHAFH